jgi:hypothetical protein
MCAVFKKNEKSGPLTMQQSVDKPRTLLLKEKLTMLVLPATNFFIFSSLISLSIVICLVCKIY